MFFALPCFWPLSEFQVFCLSQRKRKLNQRSFRLPRKSPSLPVPIPFLLATLTAMGSLTLPLLSVTTTQTSFGIQLSFGGSAPTTVTTTLCVAGAGQPSFADVNNDKKLDLVYSCNGFLTVQLGNGDGTFQAPAYYGKYIGPLVFADLNGDGYLDIAALIATANAPSQVAVFLNQGATGPGVSQLPRCMRPRLGRPAFWPATLMEMENRT